MRKQNLGLLLTTAGLVAYLAAFFASRLPSLEGVTGSVFRRGTFCLYLFEPQILLYGWFGAPGEASLVDRLPIAALAAMIVAVAMCLGWLLIVAVGADRLLRRLELLVFSTAVGLGAISTYVLAVGLAGALHYRTAFALPASVTVIAAVWLWRKRAGQSLAKQRGQSQKNAEGHGTRTALTTWPYALLWLAAPFFLIILLGSMLPPTDFDVREYHLQVPKEFFLQGRVTFLPHNVYGNMAMGTEMLSLLGMIAAGDWWQGALVGKTLVGLFAPLTALGLLAAGHRFISPVAGVVAAVAYLATPWIAKVSVNGLVEGASACYLFLAVYAILIWQEQLKQGEENSKTPSGSFAQGTCRSVPAPQRSAELLAGFLAGAAVATKYPAALFVFLPLAVWVLIVAGKQDWRTAAKGLLAFTLAGAVAGGLWFAKNWVFTGNPTYPLLYEAFDSPAWSAEKDAQWNRAHRPHEFSLGTLRSDAKRVALTSEWLSPILMPLALVGLLAACFPGALSATEPARAEKSPRQKGKPAAPCKQRQPSNTTAPIVGQEQPFEAAQRQRAKTLAIYILFVLATWWLLTHRIDRFWIPVLPLVAFLAGQGACWFAGRPWRWTVVGLLLLASLYGFLVDSSGAAGYNRYFVSLDQLRQSEDRVGLWHTWLNKHAADGRILLVGDAEPFDLVMPVTYNTVFDDSIFEQLASGKSADQVRHELSSRGVEYVFVDWAEISRYRSPGNYGFTDFIEPAVFDKLVAEGVLQPLAPPAGSDRHPGEMYRVIREKPGHSAPAESHSRSG